MHYSTTITSYFIFTLYLTIAKNHQRYDAEEVRRVMKQEESVKG
jgi:hypothetical protein